MNFLILLAAPAILALGLAFNAVRLKRSRRELSLSREAGTIHASGFDQYGENVEIGPVTLASALELLEGRLEFVRTTPGVDENVQDSGVMYYRSDDDWIGLYARSPDRVDLDVSPGLKESYGNKLTRVSPAEVRHWLNLYFSSPSAFAAAFATRADLRN